ASVSELRPAGLEKRYGATVAVAGIDLEVREGEFMTLLGPSGCGKTTTLGLIAGFFPPSAGEIYLKGQPVAGLPPFKRDIGVVFQDYALFPHMSAGDNVAFGLRMRNVAPAEIDQRVREALDLVQLGGLAERRPLRRRVHRPHELLHRGSPARRHPAGKGPALKRKIQGRLCAAGNSEAGAISRRDARISPDARGRRARAGRSAERRQRAALHDG